MKNFATKNYNKLLVLVSVLGFGIIMVSCGHNPEKLIARKWKLNSFFLEGQDTIEAKLDSASRAMSQEYYKNMLASSYYTFDSKGTYQVDLNFLKETGTWKINKDNNTLITTKTENDQAEKVETSTIDSLTESVLILSTEFANNRKATLRFVAQQ